VLNRCPIKSVDDMTPFEEWHGKKSVVHHLRTFRCIIYVRNMTSHLKKLEDFGRKVIFIGYESGSKVHHAYDPITKRVHLTRDMVFDKQDQWDWGIGGNNGEPGGGDDVFTVEYSTISQAAPETEGANEEPAEQSTLPATNDGADVDNDIDDNNLDADHNDAEVDNDIDNLDADHDYDAPLRFRSINKILGMTKFVPRALVVEQLHVVSSDDRTSFIEAECSPT
jgi:hypothetical protein